MAPSRHDWKIVDWDVKPQHKQTNKDKVIKDDGWKKLRVGLHLDEQGLVEYNYLTHCIYMSMNVRKMKFIMKYLHLPLTFLRWTISDQQASYFDEGQLIMWQQFVRRNGRKIKCKYKS